MNPQILKRYLGSIIAKQEKYPFARLVRTFSTLRSTFARERFGDNKTKIVGEGRQNENVAPIPDAFEFFAKGIGYNTECQCRSHGSFLDRIYRINRIGVEFCNHRFKIFQPFQRMAATEIEKMDGVSLFLVFNAEAQRRREITIMPCALCDSASLR